MNVWMLESKVLFDRMVVLRHKETWLHGVGFEQEFRGTKVTKVPNALLLLPAPGVGGGGYMEVSLHTELWEFAPRSVWD